MMSDMPWKGRPLGAAFVDLDAERPQKPAELGLSGKDVTDAVSWARPAE